MSTATVTAVERERAPVTYRERHRGASGRLVAMVGSALRGAGLGAFAVSAAAAFTAAQHLHLLGVIGDGLLGIGLLVAPMAAIHVMLRLGVGGARWIGQRSRRRAPRLLHVTGALLADPVTAGTLVIILVLGTASTEGSVLSLYSSLIPFETLIAAGALVGGLVGAAAAMERPGRGRLALRAAAIGLTIAVGLWAVLPGFGSPRITEAAAATIPQLDLPDPSALGPYAVASATYGSGTDHRAAFGADATWTTQTVDVSGVLTRPSGVPQLTADFMWGFGLDELPVNGRAWYAAETTTPMPVVLIVHGNHAAGEASDPGYDYLARHLASHGMFAVSVDENVLNGDAFHDYGGAEIGVRAWMLLRHLDQLRTWDASVEHPLHGRLDLSRVALIGHSRGGEAVALAASLEAADTTLSRLPPTPTGFGIRAIVALAPSDGMYHGNGAPVRLRDIDYLVMQGAHDGDLPAFSGLRTYHRVTFTGMGDHLKVAAYSYRANHGRFNTVWDTGDAGPVASWLLDRGSILSADEQQRLAKTVVGAFLERSLRERTEYDAFFREPRAGRAWLPDDILETRWQSSEQLIPVDMGAAAIDDQPIELIGFSEARRSDPGLRDGATQGSSALRLTWSGPAALTVTLDEAARPGALAADGRLTVAIASATGDPLDGPALTLTDEDGRWASVDLDEVAPLRPSLPVELWKIDALGARYLPGERLRWPAERFLSTYAVPISAFLADAPELDLGRLTALGLAFEGSGEAYVDDLGFEMGPGATAQRSAATASR
jgi:predicted dienelactone hydrolase